MVAVDQMTANSFYTGLASFIGVKNLRETLRSRFFNNKHSCKYQCKTTLTLHWHLGLTSDYIKAVNTLQNESVIIVVSSNCNQNGLFIILLHIVGRIKLEKYN